MDRNRDGLISADEMLVYASLVRKVDHVDDVNNNFIEMDADDDEFAQPAEFYRDLFA